MNQSLLALAYQGTEPDNSSMMIIVAVVLVILFLFVVIVAVGVAIFFIMRKRSKDRAAQSDLLPSSESSASAYPGMSLPEAAPAEPEFEPAPPIAQSPAPAYESPAPVYEDSSKATASAETALFDPSRTVAIIRENTTPISYGTIKFVSGVLVGQEFQVDPAGSYIGRDGTLSQIVVADPRISKRHLWIGVRDGVVKIEDQNSRNGTFINDPKSEGITEAALNSGDTVILGESDVARFEFQST